MNTENKKVDYLKVDPSIPGQDFCCLSFVEPKNNDLLANREVYFVTHFLKHFVENYKLAYDFVSKNGEDKLSEEGRKNMNLSYENILDKYTFFKNFNLSKLQLEWETLDSKNKETTISGVKVRGCYPTQEVASQKAKELQQLEPAFDVFVAQTGYWLANNPKTTNEIKAEYDEEQLNQLVKSKITEHEKNNLDFVERKQTLMNEMLKKEEEKKEQVQELPKEQKLNVMEIDDDLVEVFNSDSEDKVVKNKKEKKQVKRKRRRRNKRS